MQDEQALGVAVVEVVGDGNLAERAVDIAAVHWPPTERQEAGHLDDLAGLVGGGDVRDHDGGGVHLEGFHVVAVAALAYADDAVEVVEARGADLVLEIGPVIGHMLVAEPDGGGAGEAGHFDNARVVEVELERAGVAAGAQFAEETEGRSFMGVDFELGLRNRKSGA